MQGKTFAAIMSALALPCLISCSAREDSTRSMTPAPGHHYGLRSSFEVLVTSEAGDKISAKQNVAFRDGQAGGTVIEVRPDVIKQTMVGIGSSFTEASAFVLAHLDAEQRADVMNKVYGDAGANFSLARTPIGSTDFSVVGKYSYAPIADDAELESFSIAVDEDGFRRADYPGIKDESFDLLPMIQQALAIKRRQHDQALRDRGFGLDGAAVDEGHRGLVHRGDARE